MRIALIGATGFVGSRVLNELERRDHEVLALVRHPQRVPNRPRIRARAVDVFDVSALGRCLQQQEALISAFNPGHDPDQNPNLYRDIVEGTYAVIRAVKAAQVPYTVWLGGAGSLRVGPDLMLADDPAFPEQYDQEVPEALKRFAAQKRLSVDVPRAGRISHQLFEADRSFAWSFISPPLFMQPGVRTGEYQECGESFPWDRDRPAGISIEDYAVAVVDESERRAHVHEHFGVCAVAQ